MQVHVWGGVEGRIHQLLNPGDGLVDDKMPDAFQHIKSVSQHFAGCGKEAAIKRQDLHRFCARATLPPVQPHARVSAHPAPPRRSLALLNMALVVS